MTLLEYLESPTSMPASALAAQIGCTSSHISRLRHGTRRPSLGMALRIEQATHRCVRAADWGADERPAIQLQEQAA